MSDNNLSQCILDGDHLKLALLLTAEEGRSLLNPSETTYDFPLMLASYKDDLIAAQMLCDAGANIEYTTPNGRSALLEACSWRSTDVAMFLIEKGADIHACWHRKDTALAISCNLGLDDVVHKLLDYGAALDNPAELKESIFQAVKNNRASALDVLLKHRNIHILSDAYIADLVSLATKSNHIKCLEILINHGVNVNTQDTRGYFPLIALALSTSQTNLVDTAKLLVAHGADTSLKDIFFEKTALDHALHSGKEELVTYLRTPM